MRQSELVDWTLPVFTCRHRIEVRDDVSVPVRADLLGGRHIYEFNVLYQKIFYAWEFIGN